jgi:exopolysaccharide biosynthesis protein
MIDFSVNVGNNKRYFNAMENMTWGEWVESEYNTDGFIISEGKIYYDLNQCICVSGVNPTDIILDDGVYSLTVEMTCDGVIPG